MAKTPQDVLRQIKDEGIELFDLKFTDLHGKWQHLTVCTDLLEEESFTEGLAFDGSSIRGWKAINASDMAMVPDPSSAWIDPFYRHKTLSMICSIQDPRTGQDYDRCPRALAQRALNHLNNTGLADTAFLVLSLSSSSLTTFVTTQQREVPSTASIRSKLAGTQVASKKAATLPTKFKPKRATSL